MRRNFSAILVLGIIGFTYVDRVSGSVIFFDNPPGPGHFVWAPPPGAGFRFMDLRLGAASQPVTDQSIPAGLGQAVVTAGNLGRLSGNARNQIAAAAPPGTTGQWAMSGPAGTLFPIPGVNWATGTNNIQHTTFGGWIPEGVETFLSVRFNPTGANGTQCTSGVDCHYGWVKVVRTGLTVDALAWAYESVPETPILTPEPASAFLLGLGAFCLVGRRRTQPNRK